MVNIQYKCKLVLYFALSTYMQVQDVSKKVIQLQQAIVRTFHKKKEHNF